MSTITVPRSDVTSDEVADALRRGLGPRYNVLPGRGSTGTRSAARGPIIPDTIVVGTGSTRLFRAQVRISHDAGETILHVSPGGIGPVPRITNTALDRPQGAPGPAWRAEPALRDARCAPHRLTSTVANQAARERPDSTDRDARRARR